MPPVPASIVLISLWMFLLHGVSMAQAQQGDSLKPTCEEQLITEQGWGGETVAIAKLREAGVRAFFRGELAKKEQRIADLEKQLVEAKKPHEIPKAAEEKP